MDGYLSIREAAEKWGVSERRINQYCSEGRIPGAERKMCIRDRYNGFQTLLFPSSWFIGRCATAKSSSSFKSFASG